MPTAAPTLRALAASVLLALVVLLLPAWPARAECPMPPCVTPSSGSPATPTPAPTTAAPTASPTQGATAVPTTAPTATATATPRRTRKATSSPRPRATASDAPLSDAPSVTEEVPVGPVTGELGTPSDTPTTAPSTRAVSRTSRVGDDLGRYVLLVLGGAVLLGLAGVTGLYLTRHPREH